MIGIVKIVHLLIIILNYCVSYVIFNQIESFFKHKVCKSSFTQLFLKNELAMLHSILHRSFRIFTTLK